MRLAGLGVEMSGGDQEGIEPDSPGDADPAPWGGGPAGTPGKASAAPLRRRDLLHDYPGIAGEDPKIVACLAFVDRVAPAGMPVLIRGETGTGKELFARALHVYGPLAGGPFEALNCGAASETLFLSELFGHEKGAFTGAEDRRLGAFDRSRGGTLFLDEISEIPLKAQAALLRAIQELTYTRLGGSCPLRWEGRFVFATNADMDFLIVIGAPGSDVTISAEGRPVGSVIIGIGGKGRDGTAENPTSTEGGDSTVEVGQGGIGISIGGKGGTGLFYDDQEGNDEEIYSTCSGGPGGEGGSGGNAIKKGGNAQKGGKGADYLIFSGSSVRDPAEGADNGGMGGCPGTPGNGNPNGASASPGQNGQCDYY